MARKKESKRAVRVLVLLLVVALVAAFVAVVWIGTTRTPGTGDAATRRAVGESGARDSEVGAGSAAASSTAPAAPSASSPTAAPSAKTAAAAAPVAQAPSNRGETSPHRAPQLVGPDLARPHHVDLFLYLPSYEAAQKAAAELGRDFRSTVTRAEDGTDWKLVARRTVVPDRATMAALRSRLEEVARHHGGSYDGWEAEPVR